MRKVIPFNENWSFRKEDTGLPLTLPADWETVTLPHTWNAVDGQDGKGSYYRGACWYAKEFPTPSGLCDSRLYVEVLAASLSGRVFVNGKEAAYHEGGFSSFTADITDYLHPEGSGKANLIAIAADNSDRPHIYPRMADFTFYGGLYRGVNLIVVPRVHFDLEYWGAVSYTHLQAGVKPPALRPGFRFHAGDVLIGKTGRLRFQDAKQRDILQGIVQHLQEIQDRLHLRCRKIPGFGGDINRNSAFLQHLLKGFIPVRRSAKQDYDV